MFVCVCLQAYKKEGEDAEAAAAAAAAEKAKAEQELADKAGKLEISSAATPVRQHTTLFLL